MKKNYYIEKYCKSYFDHDIDKNIVYDLILFVIQTVSLIKY